MTLCCLTCQTSQLSSLIRDSWSDTTPMEPLSTLHDGIKVEVGRISLGNGTVGTVVYHLRRTHRSTSLCIVQSDTVSSANHILGVDTKATKCIHSNLSDLMFRQFGYIISIVSVVGQTNSYICLSSSRDDTEGFGLNKTVITLR